MTGGRGLWSSDAVVMIAVVAASIALDSSVASAATSHVVGGSTGWQTPPNSTFYSDWTATQAFAIGDNLVFNFQSGQHDVIQVPKPGYDACSTGNQIGSTLSSSPVTTTLNATGGYYYICGFAGHCSNGMKVAISVTSTPTPTAPSAPNSGGGRSEATSLLSGIRTAAGISLAGAGLSTAASLLF